MARPRMTPEESAAIIAKQSDAATQGMDPEARKVAVKSFQLGVPSDLLGSVVSFRAGAKTKLEATALGIVMRNAQKRKVLVPWGNVKCAEFVWDGE